MNEVNETSAATDIATVIVDAQDRLTTAATVEGMEMQMPTRPAGTIVTGSARTATLAETVGAATGNGIVRGALHDETRAATTTTDFIGESESHSTIAGAGGENGGTTVRRGKKTDAVLLRHQRSASRRPTSPISFPSSSANDA